MRRVFTKYPITSATNISDNIVNQIVAKVDKKVREYLTGSEGGFLEDEVQDYYRVDSRYTDDNRVIIEIRAEVSYDGLVNIGELCDPIISLYDKYAYFEPVTSGITEAYLDLDTLTKGKSIRSRRY